MALVRCEGIELEITKTGSGTKHCIRVIKGNNLILHIPMGCSVELVLEGDPKNEYPSAEEET